MADHVGALHNFAVCSEVGSLLLGGKDILSSPSCMEGPLRFGSPAEIKGRETKSKGELGFVEGPLPHSVCPKRNLLLEPNCCSCLLEHT